jgi:hypothetical protein
MPSVLVSSAEAQLLAALVGRPIDIVLHDGWAVYLESGELHLGFQPEETPAPTAEHPHACISRPAVRRRGSNLPPPGRPEWVLHELGAVTHVSLLHAWVSWSPPRWGGPIKVLNAEFPAGIEYGPILARPHSDTPTGSAVFPSDLGILLETSLGQWYLMYTDTGFFVDLAIGNIGAHFSRLVPEHSSPVRLLHCAEIHPLAARIAGGASDPPL